MRSFLEKEGEVEVEEMGEEGGGVLEEVIGGFLH